MSVPTHPKTAIYLAGPINDDDTPHVWRDDVKRQFPHVSFIDPVEWQDEWADDPDTVIDRELTTCETHPVLVCNVGENAPDTVGTHHEISHALATGNDRVAVVPNGDVAEYVSRRVPTFDTVDEAVESLLSRAVADGGDGT